MSKFVLAYQGGGGMPESPEEQEKELAKWGAWFGSLGEAVVDGGNPFAGAKTIASNGSVSASGVNLSGYSILQAENLDAAVELAKGCPVLSGGGSIEVCEAIDM